MKPETETAVMKAHFEKRLGIWLSSDDLSGLMDYVETGVQKQG